MIIGILFITLLGGLAIGSAVQRWVDKKVAEDDELHYEKLPLPCGSDEHNPYYRS
jgi:hypothetical protein